MEKARGISITSAALQFVYRDHVINLVDTPGHSDFSEDTYRVLSAVDSAVMLVDAGKGLEPQTLKLFRVCALRGIPVITVINKWDRPGLSALELMDLIEKQIKLRPTPLTWPVGEAGDFRGVLDRRTGEFVKYTRTAGGATRAPETADGARRGGGERRAGVGGRGRGARAAQPRRRRPRPGALPRRGDDAGHVRLGAAELRRRPAPGPAARPRAGAQRDPGCRRLGPRGRRRVQRVRLQGAVRDERQPSRPPRLRAGGLRARSSAGWSSPTPPPVGRSRRSSPRRSSAARRRRSRAPSPATSSAWSTRTALRVGDTVYVGDADRVPARADASPPSTS